MAISNEQLEALAFGDRQVALEDLVAGSTDHDYFQGLALIDGGDFTAAEHLIATSSERHGSSGAELRDRLRARLALRSVASDPKGSPQLAALRSLARLAHLPTGPTRTGVTTPGDAIKGPAEARHPSVLDPDTYDLKQLMMQVDPTTDELSNWGRGALVGFATDHAGWQRSDALHHAIINAAGPWLAAPELMALLLAPGMTPDVLGPHLEHLTQAQLVTLAQTHPSLSHDRQWVEAMLARLAPPHGCDPTRDMAILDALLDRLDHFTSTLSPAFAPLRATVLQHRLRRAVDCDDVAAVTTILKARLLIPDHADWRSPPPQLRSPRTPQPLQVQLQSCGLPNPPSPLEPLVREAFETILKHESDIELSDFNEFVTSDWLATTRAEILLLRGTTPSQQAAAAALLGPSRVATLQDSVEIRFVGPTTRAFASHDPVSLPLVVKNTPEVIVKVYLIDPVALYLADAPDITATIDLDGLGATHEMTLAFPGPAIRRFDHRLELPMCGGPGIWVVELIGNGRASRAVIRKGTVRHTTRFGAAGLVVTPITPDGGPLPDATLWVGKTAFKPTVPPSGGHPRFIVPFSEKRRPEKALLVDHGQGNVAQRIELAAPVEHWTLDASVVLDRQQLIAGAMATALVRPLLRIGGAPASVAILNDTFVDIATTDVDGTVATSSEDVTLDDDTETPVSFRIPERTVRVAMTLRGHVPTGDGFPAISVTKTITTDTGGIRGHNAIASLFMRRGPDGWMIELLGLCGEPLARRDIALTLAHALAPEPTTATLTTDMLGAIHLGDLEGIVSVRADAGETSRIFSLGTPHAGPKPLPGHFHMAAGDVLTLPPVPANTPILLLEMRGEVPLADQSVFVQKTDDHLRVGPLGTGDFHLLSGHSDTMRISVGSPADHGFSRRGNMLMQSSTPAPFIADHHINTGDDPHLHLSLRHVGVGTRVHIVATPRLSDPAFGPDISEDAASPQTFEFHEPLTEFISGREIGDEYRYILDRRKLPKRLGNLLTRPGILLNPWAVRATSNRRQEAQASESWRMPAPPPPAPGMAMPASAVAGPEAGFMHYLAASSKPTDDSHGRAWECHDFLGEPPVVLANLVPEPTDAGVHALSIPIHRLAGLGHLRVHIVDPAGSSTHDITSLTSPAPPRDLRLALALDPTRHYREERTLRTCEAGTTVTVGDVRTGRIEPLATIGDVQRAMTAVELRSGQNDFVTFGFIGRWHTLDMPTRLELYSQHACHELHLFLYTHDRPFFDAAVRPHLNQKFQKTFVDLWLLDGDLSAWDSPARRNDLNTMEWLLLARRQPQLRVSLARMISEWIERLPGSEERDAKFVAAVLGVNALSRTDDDIGRSNLDFEAEAVDSGGPMPEAEPSAKRKRSGKPPGGGALADDRVARRQNEAAYKAPDATREWAENNWWKQLVTDSSLIKPNRFWRDLANHIATAAETPFISAHLADVTGSFTEAMCALASLELPLAKPNHVTTRSGLALTSTFVAPAIIGHLDIAPAEDEPTSDVLVGQTFIRADDPTEFADGQTRDKTTEGPFMPGVVYRSRTVVSNPAGIQRQVNVLLQIPRGAIAVGRQLPTRTERRTLGGYATVAIDSTFYFPTACTASHFPAHVQEGARTVGAAKPLHGHGVLAVTTATPRDVRVTWPWVAAHAPDHDVLAHVAAASLGDLDLRLVLPRLGAPAFFAALVSTLETRHIFNDDVWSYAFVHRDRDRMAAWLAAHPDVLTAAGPVLEGGPFAYDPSDPRHGGKQQHLEYAPLVPARAHRLGERRVITNDGLEATYRTFLDRVAHRLAPRPDDRLAWAHYLIALDRVEDADFVWNSIDRTTVSTPMVFDHVGAWLAVSRGDLTTAVTLAKPWIQHPIPRWRALFEAVLATANGDVPADNADPREAALTRLAAATPTLHVAARYGTIELQHSGASEATLAFYPIELELLFSRAPFMEADTSRFQWISPWFTLTIPLAGEMTSVPVPDACAGRNVVIVATMAGLRRTVTHLASHLRIHVTERAGRLQVLDRRDNTMRQAAYVKVFARDRNNTVFFYKDGYTDIAGRFDYTSLSTDDLERVARFAILIIDAQCGATVVECPPPLY